MLAVIYCSVSYTAVHCSILPYLSLSLYIYIYTYMCVCVYIYIYIYILILIHMLMDGLMVGRTDRDRTMSCTWDAGSSLSLSLSLSVYIYIYTYNASCIVIVILLVNVYLISRTNTNHTMPQHHVAWQQKRVVLIQGGNKCPNPDFLGFRKNNKVFWEVRGGASKVTRRFPCSIDS